MLVARYIRYLENGTWKYASVKSVGDLEKLLTTSKTDIVSAINELIANGGALEHDLNSRFDGLEGQQNELVTITGNVQETLGKVQDDLLNKAEALYVDEQIKKLVNKEDYDANYQKIEGELLDKVNIEKYNEEYKLVTAKLNDKTDLSAFEGVEGRVTTTEQEITNVKGELGSKIGKTEFDSAVGVNRWLARKYDINIGSAGAIPSFSHIKGKQPSEVIDYDDNSVIKPFTGDYYVGHYFTNVYMKVAKTVRLTVTNDDGAVIYMNGAKMYESTTRTTGLTVAMTFRAGWNTVEILHYEHSGAVEQVSLGLKLSEQVDKLTSVIGIGDKDDTRLVEAETQIKQNAEAILLKAEGSVVTSLGNKVTANEASINLMKDEITMLVKTEDFNKYTGRLETAESTIIQHSNQISQKVEKKDYDALNNIVGEQQTSINQLTSEISLKATKSDFDGLNGRVGNAETQIKLNTEAINLRAKQTELDKTNGRLQTAESQLNVQAGQISTKVTQEDINKSIDGLNFEVRNLILNSGFARGFESWNNTSFTILPAEADKPNSKIVKVSRTGASTNSIINLISNKGNVKNGDSVSFSVDFKVTSFSAYDVKNPFIVEFYDDAGTRVQYTDVALSNMGISTLSDGKWARLTYTVKANNASITKVALRIALFRNGEVFYREPQMQIGTKATGYMLAPEDSLGAETRLANAESTIVQQATEIGLKANANDVYKKAEADGKVSTAITQAKGEIKIETDKISQNVTNLTQTVTTQGTTISNHETSITQMKGDINLRAEAKNVYTKTEADGKISTAVTNAKAEIKITTDGISQNVTNVKGDLSNLNDVVVAQGTQIKQTSDEVAINVVKKGNIKASINASTEGIKIGGQHVDITGQVTFQSLDSTMQSKVNTGISADSKAQEAKNAIADMSSDSKITPVEKVQLAKEWAVMLSEKPQYEALATTYGITTEKTNYVNAYNTLNTVLNGTGGILTNMTTTSAVTGATFRGQFDDYYDKKAQLVKKINETSKSLADGAQGTANTANNAINNNKAIWDRASNINADGKFNTNKLSGLILDAQISSATNWNGAKSLLDSWKSGTTLINGGMIATNTIFAQQIAIGDFTNLSQINEEKNPNGYSTVLLNNKRYFKIGNGAYASLTMMDNTYVEFKVNDEYYIAFNGYRDAGLTSLNLIMRYHYTDGTWANAGVISALPTTADTRVIKNLQITTAPDDTKTISRVQLFFEKDGTAGSGYYYIRDLEVRKRYTGELIVDGSIKAQQLDVNSLFAHSGFITNLKSQEIDASKIKTGQLIGIYIRSDGTNAFSYMSGGSIVSKSKVSTVETWIDEGLVRVKSSTSMLSLSEDNLSIGQIGKSGYGSITYTAPNTDPSQNLFSIWGVGKIVLESNQNDIILKGRAHIQGVDSGGVALNFPEASSIRFDRYGNINAPSTMSSEATWSIKDADNRIRILIPMGKGTQSGNEYHSHVGGHKFLHNGTLGIATYIQGGDSPIIQFNGRSILKYWGGGNYFEFKNQWDSGFVPVYASAFNTASSLIWKTDIESYEKSALDVVMGTNIVTYKYKSDVEESDNPHTHVGVIAEYAPKEIQSKDGRGVDNYAMSSLAWKAIQELSEQVRYLKEKLNNR